MIERGMPGTTGIAASDVSMKRFPGRMLSTLVEAARRRSGDGVPIQGDHLAGGAHHVEGSA
jgi:hypothetical protein